MPALISLSIFFVIGIIAAPYLSFTWWLALGLAILVVGLIAAARSNNQQVISIVVLLLAFVTGALRLSLTLSQKDPMALFTNQLLTVEGTVVREAETTSAGTTYILSVHSVIDDKTVTVNGQLLLRDLTDSGQNYRYGDIIQVRGILARPKGPQNFGQFDYRAYLEKRGIRYLLAVSSSQNIKQIGEGGANPLITYLLRARARYLQVADTLPSQDAALLRALILGERGMLEPEIVDLFTSSGTVHLMAVSGVHVGMVAAAILWAGRALRLPLLIQGLMAAMVIVVYVIWTGLTASAMRAGVMFLLGLLGAFSGRQRNSMVALAAAAVFLLLVNPWYLYDAGFQLSFVAVASILYLVPLVNIANRRVRYWLIPLLTSIAAQLGTWPLTAYYFSGVSLVGFLASVLAIPLAGLGLGFGFMGLVVGAWYLPIGQVFLGAAGMVTIALSFIARLFAKLPLAYLDVKRPPLVFLAAYYFTLLIVPRLVRNKDQKQKRWQVLVPALAVAVLVLSWRGPTGQPRLIIDFIAVGQGDAILIQSPAGQTMLIDCGPRQDFGGNVWDAGETILLPYLRSQGIRRLDLICFTHGDMDHVGGGLAIINSLPVGAVMVPQTFSGVGADMIVSEATSKGIPVYPVSRGAELDLGKNIQTIVLSPPVDPIISGSPENDNSIVLYLKHQTSGFLFTGDAGELAEHYLLSQGFPGPVHVLKVAHHGAASGTTEEFLAEIKPVVAVISVGKNNFGHPSPDAIRRLVTIGAQIFRTDQVGQIRIESDGQMMRITTFADGRRLQDAMASDLD